MAIFNRTVILSAFCMILSACGGGGSDVESTVTAQRAHASSCVVAGSQVSFTHPNPRPANELPVVATPVNFSIDLFGDSTNWIAYPYWQSKFGAMVLDHAASGATTVTALAGTDGVNLPWPQSVDAQVVVVNYGLNDGAAGMPIETYKANLRTMADINAVIVFETPNPSTHYDSGPYAQAMREVAAETGAKIIDTQACMLRRSDWSTLLYDGTHPTPEGIQYIVETCATPVIADLGCAH